MRYVSHRRQLFRPVSFIRTPHSARVSGQVGVGLRARAMRGIARFFCAAAGAALCLAGLAGAADSARTKPVSLSLAGQLTDRPASEYLAGIPFAASSGPLAASGVVLTRANLAS